MRRLLGAMAALAAAIGLWNGFSNTLDTRQEAELKIVKGRSALRLSPDASLEKGLRFAFKKDAHGEDCPPCELPNFAFEGANLRVKVAKGKVVGFTGGKISYGGTFELSGKGKALVAKNLAIVASPASQGLNLFAETAKGSLVVFDIVGPERLTRSPEGQMVFEDMQVVMSSEGAAELGEPDLDGQAIGGLTLVADIEPVEGDAEEELAELPQSQGLDLQMYAMGSLTVASNPTGRVGAFPNGRNGLTMSTSACNVGSVNIPWNAPMQVTHPVIAMNLYRELNGRFEQVGWSWLKHGFLATNSAGCGTCQNPGTGSLLGINCSDTYGTGNNGDRTYLGGRDEVNPFTGVWTCQNSWFSNYQPDCIRRNPGSDPIDAVDHRLEVHDSDLGNPGARYYYEAFYITSNDINTYNNIASREASMTWTGSAWSFSTIGAFVQGPAINRWGDLRTTAQPQTEGDVIVAVKVTDLGGGMWHYEYAVYNHNLDRQIRQFSIPLPFGATVQNVGFHDIDRNATNDWSWSQQPHALVWSTGAFGSPGANPLKYSSVFNFRFDANVPPASSKVTLGLFKPGTLTELTSDTRGPLFLDPPATFSIVNGATFGGNLQSLVDSDDDRLILGPTADGARFGTGLTTSLTAPAGAITQITIGVESNNTLTTGGGAVQTIELWNVNTSSWEVVDSRLATLSDSTTIVSITSNPTRFVNASTREVMARILHTTNLGLTGNRWKVSFDQIGFHFN